MNEYHPFEPAAGAQIIGTGAPRADYLSQSTSIEQTRAVSETLAQVTVAQNRPRNEEAALQKMLRSTKLNTLADKAFFEYPKGGAIIRDLTIGAVKEMARCWTNMHWAVIELSQDLGAGVSEMLAVAWDMEANLYARRTKIVPHVRDSNKEGRKRVTDFREIGEILGNWAARQLRTCITDLLPPWYIEATKKGFEETQTRGLKEQPIEVVRVNAINKYADDFQITREQLERFLDRGTGKWSVYDVARLRSLHGALTRGEQRIEDVFEPETLKPEDAEKAASDADTAARIQAMTIKPPAPAPEADAEAEQSDESTSQHLALLSQITAQLNALEVPTDQYDETTRLLTAGAITELVDLTPELAVAINNRLAELLATDNPVNEMVAVLDALRITLDEQQGETKT